MRKILGIGVDLVKISRMEAFLSKSTANRFLTRVLHKTER